MALHNKIYIIYIILTKQIQRIQYRDLTINMQNIFRGQSGQVNIDCWPTGLAKDRQSLIEPAVKGSTNPMTIILFP